jgi:hypothetical protein
MEYSRYAQTFSLAILAFCLSAAAPAETVLGCRPSVTVEPEYPAGAFDLNVLPLDVEFGSRGSPLAVRADLLCTVRFGGRTVSGSAAPALQNVGFLLGLPWYPFPSSDGRRSGFFAGPKAGFGYNLPGAFWATGPAIELGWAFILDRVVSSACAEGGATVFLKPGEIPRVAGHGGLSCIVGIRL